MTALRCPDVATFWTRRLGRIQPSYVAAVILTFAIVAAFGLPGREVGRGALLANLTWLTLVIPAPLVDGAYWSLLVELKFYLCCGLIVFGLRRFIRPLDGFLTLSILAVMLMAGSRLFPEFSIFSFFLSDEALLPYAPFFLVGIALHDWENVDATRLLLCALVYIIAVCLNAENLEAMLVLLAILPICATILLWPSLRIPAPIRFIGLISYPLYLVHQNIGYVALRETAGWIDSDYFAWPCNRRRGPCEPFTFHDRGAGARTIRAVNKSASRIRHLVSHGV